MGEQKEMHFYESKDIVLGPQRVTLRVAKESGDEYDSFFPGESFVFKVINDFNYNEEKKGIILGHWILPLRLIPKEFIAGQAYGLEDDCQNIEEILRYLAKDDLSSYLPITDNSDVHILVYSPSEEFDFSLLQGQDEKPQDWIERCGDSVFGHIDTYNRIKE